MRYIVLTVSTDRELLKGLPPLQLKTVGVIVSRRVHHVLSNGFEADNERAVMVLVKEDCFSSVSPTACYYIPCRRHPFIRILRRNSAKYSSWRCRVSSVIRILRRRTYVTPFRVVDLVKVHYAQNTGHLEGSLFLLPLPRQPPRTCFFSSKTSSRLNSSYCPLNYCCWSQARILAPQKKSKVLMGYNNL